MDVDGRFFRLGARRFHPKGVSYGPFAPNNEGDAFPTSGQTRADFAQIAELGANVLRVYSLPPPWFLELALAHGLRLLVDVPWNKQSCFLDRAQDRAEVVDRVRRTARACGRHPAVFALSVVNELPPDVVRWSGPGEIETFLDELVAIVKAAAPDCLCTFGNYPTTEFLRPRTVDFHCFNVYLHEPRALRNYLARLQTLAVAKPLVLGEFGMDALREGEARQATLARWTIESAFRGGVAGVIAYCFTDDWFKDGRQVEDWQFGLTTRARVPRPAFAAVQQAYRLAPRFPLRIQPRVSVVVASFNGAATLPACLESLGRLNYADYEVLLVDDGSTDETRAIAARHPAVRYLPHDRNLGLSTARNTGILAATGEIIAFTDADCRVDEDWLYHTVNELLEDGAAGVGGHNLAPGDDSWVAAAVMASPGGPAHVMLTDRVAEHIPGCNMVFWKRALLEIGCFDPAFQRAGDDVDVCWRLQQQGHRLGFSHAGFVWHARRSTVRAYLRQQRGYGEAEALLARKHPEHFNPLGGSLGQGRIYAPANLGLRTSRPMIYHGRFGGGAFQGVYTAAPSFALMVATSLEYHVLVTLPLLVLSSVFNWLLPLALASAALSVGVCAAAAAQAELPARPRRFWSRPLVGLLYALQPVVRGWARYQGRLFLRLAPLARRETLESLSRSGTDAGPHDLVYQDPPGRGREAFLQGLLGQLDQDAWLSRVDAGWGSFDIEVYGSRWSKLQLPTGSEHTAERGARVRGRLRTRWTLPARLSLGVLSGLALLAAAWFRHHGLAAWLIFLGPAALAVWFQRDQQGLRRVFAAFLDEAVRTQGFVRAGAGEAVVAGAIAPPGPVIVPVPSARHLPAAD